MKSATCWLLSVSYTPSQLRNNQSDDDNDDVEVVDVVDVEEVVDDVEDVEDDDDDDDDDEDDDEDEDVIELRVISGNAITFCCSAGMSGTFFIP